MAFRPEFREALSLLARAIRALVDAGHEPPILVGGAAVEFFTGSAVTSGDFDLVTPYQGELEEALRPYGFERRREPGVLQTCLIHEELGFAVQVVSGLLMDGKACREKISIVEFDEGGILAVIPIEDLIADRMGQAYSVDPPREDMLDQAVKLLQLAEAIDETYLDRRIREETVGEAALETLRGYLP